MIVTIIDATNMCTAGRIWGDPHFSKKKANKKQ
jgi:hypothetical protein